MANFVRLVRKSPHTGMMGANTRRFISRLEDYIPNLDRVVFKHSLYSRNGMCVWLEILSREFNEVLIFPTGPDKWAKLGLGTIYPTDRIFDEHTESLIRDGNLVYDYLDYPDEFGVLPFYKPDRSKFPEYRY